jgi:hypothetical protein
MERLLRHPDASAMLADHVLCARVVEWKGRVFARQRARYDLAVPGTLRLPPADTRLAALARDYAQMRAMFIASLPEFEVVMARLAEAERMLNASGVA